MDEGTGNGKGEVMEELWPLIVLVGMPLIGVIMMFILEDDGDAQD